MYDYVHQSHANHNQMKTAIRLRQAPNLYFYEASFPSLLRHFIDFSNPNMILDKIGKQIFKFLFVLLHIDNIT